MTIGAVVDASTGSVAVPRASAEDRRRALWTEHYPPLAGWCVALVGDVDVAHDVAAEAFTRLLSRWTTVEQPRAFLYAVAANLAKDHWRRTARDRGLVQRLSGTVVSSQPAEDPWLRDLVERLPERLRVPVLLHYYADLPVSEVATALRRPEGTVKRLLSEGRAAVLASLADDDDRRSSRG